MRERMLNEFNCIWIDNLNGSKFETGKVSPDGTPDPSVFSTESNREGIQVGTAIGLLAKHGTSTDHMVLHRNLWGAAKRDVLLSSLEAGDFDGQFTSACPIAAN